jgi:hypothetical protein
MYGRPWPSAPQIRFRRTHWRQSPAIEFLALYFRAQLVVGTVQPNMDQRRSRAAPQTQRATPLCTTAQRFAMRRSPRREAVWSNPGGLRLLLT